MHVRPCLGCVIPLLIHKERLLRLRILVLFGSESEEATGHSAKANIKLAGGITRTRSEGHQSKVSRMHRCNMRTQWQTYLDDACTLSFSPNRPMVLFRCPLLQCSPRYGKVARAHPKQGLARTRPPGPVRTRSNLQHFAWVVVAVQGTETCDS